MRELSILIFVTADGVMQAPGQVDEDPTGGFRGGWATGCWDEVMAQVGQHAMAEPFDLLLGRSTYDLFKGGHVAEGGDDTPMNRATKYVVTSRSEGLDWPSTVALDPDVATSVAALKAGEGPLLQVHGSWQLVQALLENDLVDLFRIWTFPVFVGAGKRLFVDGAVPCDLELLKSEPTPGGAVMTLYRKRRA